MKKRIITLCIALFLLLLLPTIVSADSYSAPDLLVDKADILTDNEEADITAQLEEISNRHETNIAVVTMPYTMNENGVFMGMTPEACANLFFRERSYGYGDSDDGVLFLIIMDTRDWYVTSHGFAAYAITEAGYDYIEAQVIPYLSSGDYAESFTKYAEICDELIGRAKDGDPYGYGSDDYYDDYYTPSGDPTSFRWIVTCIILGIVAAVIVVLIMASKNKSVRVKAEANSYIRPGSMRVTVSRDMFLYRNISRMRKSNDSHGGGRSGGGSRSSGRGGKF